MDPDDHLYYEVPTHLGSPLNPEILDFYRLYPGRLKKKYPDLPSSSLRDFKSGFDNGINVFRWIEEWIKTIKSPHTPEMAGLKCNILQQAKKSVEVQLKAIVKDLPAYDDRGLENFSIALDQNYDWTVLLSDRTRVAYIKQCVSELRPKIGRGLSCPGLKGVSFHYNLVLLESFPINHLCITYDMFVGVLDKIESHYQLKTQWILLMEIPEYRQIDYMSKQEELYKVLDQAYDQLGVLAHHLFKALEAICLGSCLMYDPERSADTRFLPEVLSGLREKDSRVGAYGEHISEMMSRWLNQYRDVARLGVMESYGQEKLHFYPIVDTEAGHKKMHKYGTSVRVIDFALSDDVLGSMKRTFVWNFFQKKNKLPLIIPSLQLHPKILDIFSWNSIPSRAHLLDIPVRSWSNVQFQKNFEYDYRIEDLDNLIDRSVAPSSMKYTQVLDTDVILEAGLTQTLEKDHRRFLLWMLDQPSVDCKEYFNEFDRARRIPEECNMILLCPKELEQKIEARDFSILHPKVRIAITSLDHNISKSILPYFPFQSISLNGSDLQSRIRDLVSGKRRDGYTTVAFNLDYSQWNYTFREEMTVKFDRFFNQLFGVNHFQWGARVFKESLIRSGTKYGYGRILGTFSEWRHHLGGNQGIRQKFWTILTQSAITLGMERLKYSYDLIGSGDNQVIIAKLPIDGGLRTNIERIKMTIRACTEGLGLEIKVEESWHSETMFSYGRKYYFNENPLSLATKATNRFTTGLKEGYTSVEAHVSTAFGAGQQLAMTTRHPLLGYYLGTLEFIVGLLITPHWREIISPVRDRLWVLPCISCNLSILPTMQLTGSLYSGHKDVLTENLALLKIICESNEEDRMDISRLLKIQFAPVTSESNLSLILDPWSPNIEKPISTKSFIKRKVVDYLLNVLHVQNITLSQKLQLLDGMAPEHLAESLLQISPINLTVIHGLFESSMIGSVLASVNKFTGMKTIITATDREGQRQSKNSFQTTMRSIDSKILKSLTNSLQSAPIPEPIFYKMILGPISYDFENWAHTQQKPIHCTLTLRRFMMIRSHGLPDTGVIGPFCPAPMEQVHWKRLLVTDDLSTSIIIHPAHKIPPTLGELDTTKGPFPKLIGNQTADPIRTMKLVNLGGEEHGQAIRTLVHIGTWMKLNGNNEKIQSFIKAELDSRLPGLAAIYEQMNLATAGGCLEHRIRTPGMDMGSYSNSLSNASTHFKLSTDRATIFQRSRDDFDVFFQQLFHYGIAITRFNKLYHKLARLEIRLDCCTEKIIEYDYTCTRMIEYPSLSFQRPNLSTISLQAELLRVVESENLETDHKLIFHHGRLQGIASALAYQMVGYITKYRKGKMLHHSDIMHSSSPTSLLNVTLIREVPISLLLRSLVLAMDYRGMFRDCRHVGEIITRLTDWSTGLTSTVDYREFSPLLDALVSAGKLQELILFTRSNLQFRGQRSTITFLSNLMTGLAKAARSLHRSRAQTTILIFSSSIIGHERRINGLLRRWSRWYLKKGIHIRGGSLSSQISDRHGKMGTVNLSFCQDLDLYLESVRALPLEDPQASDHYRSSPMKMVNPIEIQNLPLQGSFSCSNLSSRNFLRDLPETEGYLEQRTQPLDPLHRMFQLLRWNSSVSGASIKLCEILSREGINIADIPSCVCLAEGGGSMMSTLLHINPLMRGIYNSLMDETTLTSQSAGGYYPEGLICPCDVASRVLNLPFLSTRNGDLNVNETWNEIRLQVQLLTMSKFILTWDMESISPGRDQGLIHLSEFIIIHLPFVAIIKVIPQDLLLLADSLLPQWSGQGFSWVLRRLTSSNVWGNELYLILTKEKGPQSSIKPSEAYRLSNLMIMESQRIDIVTQIRTLILFNDLINQVQLCTLADPYSNSSFTMISDPDCQGISILTKLINNITYIEDYPSSELFKDMQVLLLSNTNGAKSIIDDYSSMLTSLYMLYQMGACESELPVSQLKRDFGITHFHRLMDVLKNRTFGQQERRYQDITWRRLGWSLFFRQTILNLQESNLITTYDMAYTRLFKSSMERYKTLQIPPEVISIVQTRTLLEVRLHPGLFMYPGGLSKCIHYLKQIAVQFGPIARLGSVEPGWMRGMILQMYLPVSFQVTADYILHFKQGYPGDKIEITQQVQEVILHYWYEGQPTILNYGPGMWVGGSKKGHRLLKIVVQSSFN